MPRPQARSGRPAARPVPEDLPAFDEPFDKILAVNAMMSVWREPVARSRSSAACCGAVA